MNMDEPHRETILEEEPNDDDDELKNQLKTAKEEIQSLTQQLNCLLLLAKNAWRGDETATLHLARVIGINPDEEPSKFIEKKPTPPPRNPSKRTVTISNDNNNNEEPTLKKTPSLSSSSSQETLQAQEQEEEEDVQPFQSVMKSTYLQPFLKQSHIDPIRGQKPRQIFNNMIRHHQTEARKPPPITPPTRNNSSTVRPRATKHLYRPASAEHVVRHLGSPMSRRKPYFVFAGREFFQQTNNYAPLYQRALVTSAGSRQSQHSDFSDHSDVLTSGVLDPVPTRPQTSKTTQQNSMIRFGTRSVVSDEPNARISSAISSTTRSRTTQMSERERRDAMRLQQQLNLPRPGWLNQQRA